MNSGKALELNNQAVLAWKNQKRDEALELLFAAKKQDSLCPEVLFNQQIMAMALGETGLGAVVDHVQSLFTQFPPASSWRLPYFLGTLVQAAYPDNPQPRHLLEETRCLFDELGEKGEVDDHFQKEWIPISDHYSRESQMSEAAPFPGFHFKSHVESLARGTLPAIKSAAISPDQKIAWLGHDDGRLSIFNLEGASLEKTFASGVSRVLSLAFSPTGAFVVSGGGDAKIRLWDTRGSHLMRTFDGHRSEVRALAMTSDGCRFLSGGSDGQLLLWDIMAGDKIGSLIIMKTGLWSGQKHSRVVACAVSPNGRLAVAGYDSGFMPLLWELSTGRMIAVLVGMSNQAVSLMFSQDGRHVFGEDKEKNVQCWNVEKPRHLQLPLIRNLISK